MLRSVELKDYMVHKPVTVSVGAPVLEAVTEILAHKVSGVCVVDSDGLLVGVLSEMDCLKAILGATYNDSVTGMVEQYMETNVVTANPTDDIVDVAADMLKNKHRRRPVVLNGKLIGQVTVRQLLRAVEEFASGDRVLSPS